MAHTSIATRRATIAQEIWPLALAGLGFAGLLGAARALCEALLILEGSGAMGGTRERARR
jgi:ABC-type phosphate transport system permease subunit